MALWIGRELRKEGRLMEAYYCGISKLEVESDCGVSRISQHDCEWTERANMLCRSVFEKHTGIKLAPGEVRKIKSIKIELEEV